MTDKQITFNQLNPIVIEFAEEVHMTPHDLARHPAMSSEQIPGTGYPVRFLTLGFIPILRLFDDMATEPLAKKVRRALFLALALLSLGAAFLTSSNRYLLHTTREDTPQARFAARMRETKREPEISLFCYAFPDGGFYLAADVIPAYRYFATSNVGRPEIGREQSRYLQEKSAEFVITRNRDETLEGYRLVESQVFWSEGYDDEYRLYQREE